MKNYSLRRRYFPFGTLSTLHRQDGSHVCFMLERADENNAPNKSCVPEGTYHLVPHTSPKFGECYALEAPTLGVTRQGPSLRTHILIHTANTPSQLQGCLAPGVDVGYVNEEVGVIRSRDAFKALMKELGGEPATLTIKKD